MSPPKRRELVEALERVESAFREVSLIDGPAFKEPLRIDEIRELLEREKDRGIMVLPADCPDFYIGRYPFRKKQAAVSAVETLARLGSFARTRPCEGGYELQWLLKNGRVDW